MAEENARTDETDELEPEGQRDEAADHATSEEENNEATERSTARWAIRGAVIGAVAGSAAGAGVGMLVARRPEALEQTKSAILGNGKHVAVAAAIAATEAVTSRGLKQIVTGEGNGDRSQTVKQTAREAGAAAAQAARDAIIPLRREANDS
jgi:hypothetical protein